MAQAKPGDTVRVNYTGKLEDGTVFDSSIDVDPLRFTIGEGQLIPGFEEAVVGMEPGESKTATIAAEKAYGPVREEMIWELERESLPENIDPKVGEQLQVRHADNRTFVVQVVGVTETKVTLDANHPLAGKELVFDLELVQID